MTRRERRFVAMFVDIFDAEIVEWPRSTFRTTAIPAPTPVPTTQTTQTPIAQRAPRVRRTKLPNNQTTVISDRQERFDFGLE